MSELDTHQLRRAFGSFLTGVTVVTAVGADGAPVGFTANSYTSVSLDPPLLLVCPAQTLSSFPVFNRCDHFAVNILADDQRDVANVFAGSPGDRFAQINWSADDSGCPLIQDAAAWFSCSTHDRLMAGDHLILVGRVDAFAASDRDGLGYSSEGYFSLGIERAVAELTQRRRVQAGAIIEHDGKILLQTTAAGLRPPQVEATGNASALATIRDYLNEAGVAVDFGPVYSMFEHQGAGQNFIYYRAIARQADPGGVGQYVPASELTEQRYTNEALAVMLERYQLERSQGVFGFYVGDEASGDVHLFGEGNRMDQEQQ